MKVTDLIEALKRANKLFKKKYNIPLEIFDLEFNSADAEGMLIRAAGKVIYNNYMRIVINFNVEDGEIVNMEMKEEK